VQVRSAHIRGQRIRRFDQVGGNNPQLRRVNLQLEHATPPETIVMNADSKIARRPRSAARYGSTGSA
jgi:hypothetical protein